MYPVWTGLITAGSFVGLYLSFQIGYRLDEWIVWIFTPREKSTSETHTVMHYELLTAFETECRLQEKVSRLEEEVYAAQVAVYHQDDAIDANTIQEVIDSMNSQQKDALYYTLGVALDVAEEKVKSAVQYPPYDHLDL